MKTTTDHLALMTNDGEVLKIESTGDAIMLVLSGESITGYGPFVMNTREQVKEAFDDFKEG